jgi:sirohydrochlorin cobaltochelatase
MRPTLAFALLVRLIGATAAPTTISAQAGSPPAPVGTIVVAHGGSAEWNGYVLDVAGRARTGGPVEVSFLMGEAARSRRFQDAVARLERAGVSRIVVVPMLVSSHSGHYEQIRWLAGETDSLDAVMHHHLHMSGIERPDTRTPMVVTRAMDDSPEVARVLADRAKAIATAPSEQALFLVGHGPNEAAEYAEWMRNLRPVADSVRVWVGFRDVKVDLVRDDAPAPVRAEAVRRVRELIDLQARLTGRDVVVVPVLVSRGRVSREKFMADLVGLPVVYTGEPLLPHPHLATWIESRVREGTGAAPAAASMAR